ncbi:MAG: hypothetical protein JKY93_03555 [Gammaproteobacteria bacterium]|nr:hypothetical protein [Gammaproteobacteria bacterium]
MLDLTTADKALISIASLIDTYQSSDSAHEVLWLECLNDLLANVSREYKKIDQLCDCLVAIEEAAALFGRASPNYTRARYELRNAVRDVSQWRAAFHYAQWEKQQAAA